jgi:hypothetical protein
MKSFKATASLILALIMVFVCSASALAAIPGTQVGNKLTATVTANEAPQFVWNVDGDPFGIDDISSKLPGVTATVGVSGPENVPSITFSGAMLSSDLTTQYPTIAGTSWDAAYVTWYVLVPEGATHVTYAEATSSTGVVEIPLGPAGDPATNMDGQTVQIGGLTYLKVLGQFASKGTNPTDKWAITVGTSFDGIPSMATFPIQFGTSDGTTWASVGNLIKVRNIYASDFVINEPEAKIELAWASGTGILTPDASGNVTVTAGYTSKVGVNLKNTGTADLAKGLVIVTIKNSAGNAVMSGVSMVSGGESVGAGDDYYYWGPSTGFDILKGWNQTTVFDVKFAEAGVYSVEVFVVQLP